MNNLKRIVKQTMFDLSIIFNGERLIIIQNDLRACLPSNLLMNSIAWIAFLPCPIVPLYYIAKLINIVTLMQL